MTTDDLENAWESVNRQLSSLGIAVLQLVAVLVVASLLSRWLRRWLRRRLIESPSPTVAVVAENTASVGIYVVAFTIVLALWGMTWTNLITALSISTVAVAFGFQDLLRSVVGGLLVIFERPFAPGDRIKIRDIEGKVERIDLRKTVLKADNGDRIAMPNALMFSDPVINRSPNRISRVLVVSGIDGSPAEVRQKAQEAFSDLTGLDGTPKIYVRTHQNRRKSRSAIDAVPGVDRLYKKDEQGHEVVRATGMKIVWSSSHDTARREDVKKRLLEVFPDARVDTVNW